MRLLETMPDKLAKNPAWKKSHPSSQASLAHLFQPSRGIYMVSPLVLHGLFMDNLEVWSLKMHSRQRPPRSAPKRTSWRVPFTTLSGTRWTSVSWCRPSWSSARKAGVLP